MARKPVQSHWPDQKKRERLTLAAEHPKQLPLFGGASGCKPGGDPELNKPAGDSSAEARGPRMSLETSQSLDSRKLFEHPPEDILEAYLLGRLPGQQAEQDDDPEVVAIETHLLACGQCVEAAELLDATVQAIRHALNLKKPRRRSKPKVLTAGSFS